MRAFYRTTGDTAIDVTLSPKNTVRGWQLDEMRLHLNAAGGAAEDLTLIVVSAADAVYNSLLLTEAMAAAANVRYHPDQPVLMDNGDGIRVQYANTNGRTYGLELIYSVF